MLILDVPNMVFDLKLTFIFEWCMVGCESECTPKRHVLKRD